MIRLLRTLIACAAFTLPLVAAPVPKAVMKQSDEKAILGHWRGTTLPVSANQTVYTFCFSADGTCGIGHNGQAALSDCVYSLDPSGTPKRMKWLNGSERTEWRCVYELDGDMLRIGFVPPNQEVPNNLELKNNLTVYELKRVKEEK
jgi:uncharacterized protein (TIGR03067 family)